MKEALTSQHFARGSRSQCFVEAIIRSHSRRFAVFAAEPLPALPNLPIRAQEASVYGTHTGASTDQAQEAIAAETVRIVKSFKETGQVPNVVNLAARTPATHRLVVRHRDRPGVLAQVLEAIKAEQINVQEMENIVFEGAEAAVARINLDKAPSSATLDHLRDEIGRYRSCFMDLMITRSARRNFYVWVSITALLAAARGTNFPGPRYGIGVKVAQEGKIY